MRSKSLAALKAASLRHYPYPLARMLLALSKVSIVHRIVFRYHMPVTHHKQHCILDIMFFYNIIRLGLLTICHHVATRGLHLPDSAYFPNDRCGTISACCAAGSLLSTCRKESHWLLKRWRKASNAVSIAGQVSSRQISISDLSPTFITNLDF